MEARIVDRRKRYYALGPHQFDPLGFLARYTAGLKMQVEWAKKRRAEKEKAK